jgi:autotransporter-associated beta strand protein
MSGGTFTQTGGNPFFIGIFGGAHGIWNQSGGALTMPNVLHIGDGCTGDLNLSGGSIYANSEVWIGQGGSGVGTMTISGGAFTNNSWLAVGREGSQGVLNISGGTMVKQGGGNISITHNSGASGTVNQSGGTFICASGETWIGENGGLGTWTMDGGTSIFGVVHLAQNADAQGVLNLNGGSLTATEISTGNTGASQRELNLNGGTIVAGADNASFIHDLSAANVLTNGAVFDTASYTVGVNQDLLGGTDDVGLTKVGAGTLYLNGANTYTNTTMVNAGALGGSGTIQGSVAVASGARLSPGNASIGTLTINNTLSLASGSSTLVKISMDGGATNDMVSGLTDVSYDGTLVVTNAGGTALVPGTQFQLFNTASHSGNYVNAALVSILPAGAGTFDPATGKLTITSSGVVSFHPVVVSNGSLILTGDGGAAPGSDYTLLTSTNVALPLSQWSTNTTGVLDSMGMFSNNIPLNSPDAARFFDVRVP